MFMVRVSGYLTERALQKGYLVKDINIYGLLVSHKSVNEETVIMKGDEILFEEALKLVLTHI